MGAVRGAESRSQRCRASASRPALSHHLSSFGKAAKLSFSVWDHGRIQRLIDSRGRSLLFSFFVFCCSWKCGSSSNRARFVSRVAAHLCAHDGAGQHAQQLGGLSGAQNARDQVSFLPFSRRLSPGEFSKEKVFSFSFVNCGVKTTKGSASVGSQGKDLCWRGHVESAD